MIPLHKLKKLPRSQRLRKAAKIFGEAEARFITSGRMSAEDAEYFAALMKMLEGEDGFLPSAIAALWKARVTIEAASVSASCAAVPSTVASSAAGSNEIRRALNTAYHLLLSETGCFMSDWDFVESGGALDPSKRQPFPGMHVYLEDIRAPFNVGAMFRTAESFGAEKIWLSPLCADPRHKRAERTAMGCVDLLPWERFNLDPFSGSKFSESKVSESKVSGSEVSESEVSESKASGSNESAPAGSLFQEGPIFAMETGGIPLAEFPFPSRGILIAGSEELGVSPLALAAADASLGRISIPSYGAKGSLNVSVAFGIVMQAWAESANRRQ